jgi:hypothetical protein
MSTQPVSNSLFQELQSFYQSRSADVKQLGSALQAGNLKKAEQVYGALVALGQNGPFSNSEAFASPGRANAFEAVGQALQTGDLAGAQAAFAKLQQASSQHQGALVNAAFVVTITSTQNQPVEQDKTGFWRQRKLDLDQLGTALQSEDTAAVQKAYDALVALGQSGPLRNGATFHRASRAADFATIGQALQSGDLAGAQQAFSALEDSFKPQTTALLGPPTPAPAQLPLGPPTPAPVPSTIPPQGTLPPGPPTPAPAPSTLPPHALPPGPPTLVSPPSATGGGPSGPPEIIGNATGTHGHNRHRLVKNALEANSPSTDKNKTVSIQA